MPAFCSTVFGMVFASHGMFQLERTGKQKHSCSGDCKMSLADKAKTTVRIVSVEKAKPPKVVVPEWMDWLDDCKKEREELEARLTEEESQCEHCGPLKELKNSLERANSLNRSLTDGCMDYQKKLAEAQQLMKEFPNYGGIVQAYAEGETWLHIDFPAKEYVRDVLSWFLRLRGAVGT